MFSMLKFLISFCVSFVLLSIPVQNKPLFFYLNSWAKPITQEIFADSKDVLLKGVRQGKSFGKKLFNNTAPTIDKINLSSSSIDKGKGEVKVAPEIDHDETYTEEEKDMLIKILKEQ